MARTIKIGLDYFPFDIDFFDDEKVQFVSAKFGIKGEIVAIKLLAKIYRNGYYLKWGKDECILFAKRAGEGINFQLVDQIVEELILRDFFSKEMYEVHGILTSRGIQRRYFEATTRRKKIDLQHAYCIIDIDDYNNVINASINSINDNISTQRKEKESKEEKIKVEERIGNDSDGDFSLLKDETTAKQKVENLLKTYTDKNSIDYDADIKPILDFLYDPRFTVDETYPEIFNSFLVLKQAEKTSTSYLMGIIKRKLQTLYDSKEAIKKKKDLAEADQHRIKAAKDKIEADRLFSQEKIKEYKEKYNSNETIFSTKEKTEIKRSLEKGDWVFAGSIIDAKIQETVLI